MARVTGPLHSTDASGAVGQALVYGKWKGLNWVRHWTKPANPQSISQQRVRVLMGQCVVWWQSLTDDQRGEWDDKALVFPNIDPITGLPSDWSGFNLFTSIHIMKARLGAADLPHIAPPTEGRPNLGDWLKAEQVWPPPLDLDLDDHPIISLLPKVAASPGRVIIAYIQRYLGLGEKPSWKKASLDECLYAPFTGDPVTFTLTGQTINPGERFTAWLRPINITPPRGLMGTITALEVVTNPET